jgi:hypothetical protein
MAVSLTTLLPPTRSGRTLFVSSSLLGAFALLQLAMLGWHLLRSHAQPHAPETLVLHFAETMEPSASAIDVPYHRDPLTADAGSSAAVTTSPLDSVARPTPATASVDQQTMAAAAAGNSAAAGLIEQARRLRQNGDVTGALAELRQAQLDDPASPQVIAELGITYEALQLPDRAFEQWQRLYSMGDSIGALYYLADEKLHNAPPAPAAPGTALLGQAAQPPSDLTGNGRDANGFQENALLRITNIQSEDEEDPNAEKKVSLKIMVKNRPGSAIDPKKVVIQTYFYDLVDGKLVLQTNAQTSYAWLTKPVTWENDQSQVLQTTYLRPKAAPIPTPAPAATPDNSKHGRKAAKGSPPAAEPADTPPAPAPQVRIYLGYVVRLYYDRQLQDVQADPLRLLQQFPPPLTLPEE